jgi:Zn-dependent M28 family amino/carboxypeptidase
MKFVRRSILPLALALVLGVGYFAYSQDTLGPQHFSGERALERIAEHMAFGPRTTGSAESIRAGDAVLEYLENLGWETTEDWHTLQFDNGPLLVPARNLVASYGSGPTVILGGHYDTRVYADQDPDPEKRKQRVPGANDGGSTVGVLMELARVISEHYLPNNEIRLIFFDAEDNPNIPPWTISIGADLYVDNLNLEEENIRYGIMIDMVGDQNQMIPIEGHSLNAAPELVEAIWTLADELGYGRQFDRDGNGFIARYSITDDHLPFIRVGIPAVLLIDFDYPYWHTMQDTLDKLSADSLERVGRLLEAFLEQDGAMRRK